MTEQLKVVGYRRWEGKEGVFRQDGKSEKGRAEEVVKQGEVTHWGTRDERKCK